MNTFSLNLEEYKDLCDEATDLIQSVTADGHFRYVNNTWLRVLGYTKREVTKMTIFDIIHSDEIEHCQKLFKKVMMGEDVGLVTTTFVTKNGQNIIVEGNVNCNFIGGKPVYTRAVFRDITKHKQIEEALEESGEIWRSLVENAPNIIMLVDHDKRIQFINHVVPGLTPESVVGKSIYDFIPAEFQETVKEVVDKVFQSGETAIYETMGTGPDGTVSWYETSVAPRKHDGHIIGVIQITLDITDRKKAEEKVEQLYEQEKELSQRLEKEMKRREEFANILVHELKTPLVPIIASSELLADELHDEQLLKITRGIQRGASTLNSRIDTMLDVARGELGTLGLKYKEVDVLALINQIVEEVSPVASNQELSFVLEVPSALPSIWADEGRLEQVIMNILTNAFKFTPREGAVTLRVKERDTALLVEVQDTGSGITKENWHKIFEAYYRVDSGKQRPAGLGLGLALCKTIVEAHGGKIWVESEEGKGSSFSFSIPFKAANESTQDS